MSSIINQNNVESFLKSFEKLAASIRDLDNAYCIIKLSLSDTQIDVSWREHYYKHIPILR